MKRGIVKKGLLLAVFLFVGMLMASPAGAWTIEGVDTPKQFTNFYPRAIAIDGANLPHIAYGRDHLYYAHFDGAVWQYETVDDSPGVGRYASIALDTAGNVHISYYDWTNRDLKYATNFVKVDPVAVAEGLCFIATAAFSTPLAQEVEVLSRLRDEYLLTNESGQRFVAFYEHHSPALAEFISEREWAKRVVRIALWPLVRMAEFIVD